MGSVFIRILMMAENFEVLFTSLQGRYAKALFAEGQKANCLEEISKNFAMLGSFFDTNCNIKNVLSGQYWNKSELDKMWVSIGKHLSFCPLFLNFVRLVTSNDRFGLLDKMRHIYNIAYARYKNVRSVIVYSVVRLKVAQKRVEKLVSKIFDGDVMVEYEIDEKLLAGIKILSDGRVIDVSALAKIKQLADFCQDLEHIPAQNLMHEPA